MTDSPYVPMTNWRNVGLFWDKMPGLFHCGIRTPWGNVVLKPYSQRLFSERYGISKGLKIGSMYLRWVRLKRFRA